MFKFKIIIFNVFLLLLLLSYKRLALAEEKSIPDLSYTLKLEKEILKIELSFRANNSTETTLLLPSSGAGQTKYYKAISELKTYSSETKIFDTDKPEIKRLIHKPNQQIHLSYILKQDFTGFLTHKNYYRPIINKDYFLFSGNAGFIIPDLEKPSPLKIILKWKLPLKWKLANSFGANTDTQEFETGIKQLRNGLFIAGDFRITKVEIKNKPLYIALRGKWKFTDAEYIKLVKKVVESQRTFWNDFDFPHFLISMIPVNGSGYSSGGTSMTNAFPTFFGFKTESLKPIKEILSHELFHIWNGSKIYIPSHDEELMYWFSEGFTDYYSRLLNLRAGIITLEEYIEDYNEVIKQYYSSPARNKTNIDVVKYFWSDDYVRNLPYQQGDILATNWNTKIKSASNNNFSLDNFMKDMLKSANEENNEASIMNFNHTISKYLKEGVEKEFSENIENGKLIIPEKGALGPCVDYQNDLNIPQYKLNKTLYDKDSVSCLKWFNNNAESTILNKK